MKFTFLGHSAFLLETQNTTLLFDPFITPNPKAAHIDINTLNPAYILLSHAHGDHIADAASVAARTGATIVSNYEIVSHYMKENLQGHPMNTGGSFVFPFGTVVYTNALHSSSFPDGSYGGNPGGFIIANSEGTLYFAGDTALTYDMQLLGKRYAIDICILPIGSNFTMDAIDAARAAVLLGCKRCIGVHFDTFPWIEIDHQQARKAFADAGVELIIPEIGQSIDL